RRHTRFSRDWSSDVCSSDLYKMGGALLAEATGVPVIPIALNAGECWPRRAFLKKPGMVTVSVGPPIQTQGLSAAEINEKVQAWKIGRASCRGGARVGGGE